MRFIACTTALLLCVTFAAGTHLRAVSHEVLQHGMREYPCSVSAGETNAQEAADKSCTERMGESAICDKKNWECVDLQSRLNGILNGIEAAGVLPADVLDTYSVNEIAAAVVGRIGTVCNVEAKRTEKQGARRLLDTDMRKGTIMMAISGKYIPDMLKTGFRNKFQLGKGTYGNGDRALIYDTKRAATEDRLACLKIGAPKRGSEATFQKAFYYEATPSDSVGSEYGQNLSPPGSAEPHNFPPLKVWSDVSFDKEDALALTALVESASLELKKSTHHSGEGASNTCSKLLDPGMKENAKWVYKKCDAESCGSDNANLFRKTCVANNDNKEIGEVQWFRQPGPVVAIDKIKTNNIRPKSAFFLPDGIKQGDIPTAYGDTWVVFRQSIQNRAVVTVGDSLDTKPVYKEWAARGGNRVPNLESDRLVFKKGPAIGQGTGQIATNLKMEDGMLQAERQMRFGMGLTGKVGKNRKTGTASWWPAIAESLVGQNVQTKAEHVSIPKDTKGIVVAANATGVMIEFENGMRLEARTGQGDDKTHVVVSVARSDDQEFADDKDGPSLLDSMLNVDAKAHHDELRKISEHPEWLRAFTFDETKLAELSCPTGWCTNPKARNKVPDYYEAMIWGDLNFTDVATVLLREDQKGAVDESVIKVLAAEFPSLPVWSFPGSANVASKVTPRNRPARGLNYECKDLNNNPVPMTALYMENIPNTGKHQRIIPKAMCCEKIVQGDGSSCTLSQESLKMLFPGSGLGTGGIIYKSLLADKTFERNYNTTTTQQHKCEVNGNSYTAPKGTKIHKCSEEYTFPLPLKTLRL